jgi:hypothetical protein
MAITLDPPEVATPTPTPSPSRRRPPKPAARATGIGWVQWLVAALLVGAGAVHLALAPSHFGESTVEGIGFVVAAWLQIALAIAVLLRPTRAVIFTIIAVSAASIGAWAVSRIWGLPFGEHADHAENVTVVDGLTVVMEAFTLVLAATLLSSSVRRFRSRSYAVIAVVAVLGLTSALIAAPEARDHSAAAHGDTHSDAASGATGATGGAAGHTHDATAASASSSGQVTDLNGHVVKGVKAHDVAHEQEPDQLLDAPTRAVLASQLAAARATAMAFPTVADAERAGYHLVGGAYGPGAGAHYIGGFGGGAFRGFDAAHPPTLIYDGVSPTAQIVGLMYLGMGANAAAPEGFAGPNDHWHRHSGVCLKAGKAIFPVDADVTAEQCASKGGSYIATTTWMVHAWVVPGWESSSGVFSHENPNLPCADGTFNTDDVGGCIGPGDVA